VKRTLSAKLVRFILAGVLNTLFGYAVFAGLTMMGWSDLFSVPSAMAAGIAFNFVSYGKLVFSSLDIRRVPRFVAGYLCLYACDVFGLRLLSRLGMSSYAGQALLVVPLAVVAFFINDRWVFRGS
jgi:putative flippase GtrA